MHSASSTGSSRSFPMPELPTGTVTFLFTDLEGSTRLWEEHPEAMRDALARHDEILRDAVEKYEGEVVKTTGDGLHAAFGTAHDAVAAAIEAQRGLGAEPWTLPDPLLVRMGVHTGEADLREGDYFGTAVNRAAPRIGRRARRAGHRVARDGRARARPPPRRGHARGSRRAPPPGSRPPRAGLPGSCARADGGLPTPPLPRRVPRQPPGRARRRSSAATRNWGRSPTRCVRRRWSR